MHTPKKVDEKFVNIVAMFPSTVTETIDEEGNVVCAIDKVIE